MYKSNEYYKIRQLRRRLQLWAPEDENSDTPTFEIRLSQKGSLVRKKPGAKGRTFLQNLRIYLRMKMYIDKSLARNPYHAAVLYASKHPEWNDGSAKNIDIALNVYRKVTNTINKC
jgi:hypothetical protein